MGGRRVREADDVSYMVLESRDAAPPRLTTHFPFTYPPSHYDGGLFRLQLLFSDRFPEVQPRARFLTPLYHPHVTESGVPWYRPARVDDVKSHVIALARLLDEDPSPDPIGHVNAAAARLCFGTKDERKEYGRNARRCANRSVEYNV